MYAEPTTYEEIHQRALLIKRRFFPHLRPGAVVPTTRADRLDEQAGRAVELLALQARSVGVEEYQHNTDTWDQADAWNILVADVCERHMVTLMQILKVDRKDLMSAARRDLAWLMARYTDESYVSLAERMHRHRTNIIAMISYEDRRRQVRAR